MILKDRKGLKQEAARALQGASSNPFRLVLIHTAAAVGVTLLLTLITWLLGKHSASAQGLAGLGVQSFFDSISSFLTLANTLILPFWEAGLLFCALCWARGEDADTQSLLQGFRRFGPVLRLTLLRILLTSGLTMLAVNLGSMIFMLTPLSGMLVNALLPVLQGQALPEPSMLLSLLPMMLVILAVTAVLQVAVLYRFRMADYLILSGETNSAVAALALSARMMKHKTLDLLKLDLSYWWFYGLQLIILLLAYLEPVLVLTGVKVSISPDALFFIGYLLSLAGQLLLYWFCRGQVETTYATVFCKLRQELPQIPGPQ